MDSSSTEIWPLSLGVWEHWPYSAQAIIQDIVKDATRHKAPRNQIMLLMSSCDFFTIFLGAIIGPAMAPKGSSIGSGQSIAVRHAAGGLSNIYNRNCIRIVQCLVWRAVAWACALLSIHSTHCNSLEYHSWIECEECTKAREKYQQYPWQYLLYTLTFV